LHIGNWEIIAKAISLCGGNLAGVYRPIRNPYLDRYVHARREKLYPAGLLFKGTKGGTMPIGVAARVAIDFLRHGGQLGLIADQVDDGAPFTVPFFGHAAKFTVAPALFARRLRAKIYVAQCLRQEECSRFRVEWRELEVPLTPEADADIKTLTAIMVAQFETWIRQAPEQWMWWQRRSIGTLQS
jgi:KDO2-lipid IV(A) lauroyltransferase